MIAPPPTHLSHISGAYCWLERSRDLGGQGIWVRSMAMWKSKAVEMQMLGC